MEANCVPRVLQLLAEVPEEAIQAPTLRIVGNCMSGSDTQTQAILDFGVLPILSSLLDSESRNIRKETCWTLSNVTSGTISQVQQVLESPGLFSKIIEMIQSSEDSEIQKEATWVVSNATSNREPKQIAHIIEQGAVGPLVELLKKRSIVLDIALEGLENILGEYLRIPPPPPPPTLLTDLNIVSAPNRVYVHSVSPLPTHPPTHSPDTLDVSKASNTAAFRLAVGSVLDRGGLSALQRLQEVDDPIGQRADTLLRTFAKDLDGSPPDDDDAAAGAAAAAAPVVSVPLEAEQFPPFEVSGCMDGLC